MEKFKLLRDEKGLTLVELVIASVILLLVLGMSYSFYAYSARSSAVASRQSDMQQNVRLAKTLIENKIRLAGYVKVGTPAVPANHCRIYLDNGKIMIHYQGETAKDLLGGLSGNIIMDLSFTVTGDAFIEVMVGASDGVNNYDISAEVLILKRNIDNVVGDSDSQLYYSD
ncbi:MAG: prepilin-type N-terminal cleavage/methylation domain-containing protein [Bacillota bacterium]